MSFFTALKITDGINTAAVKPASTAPVATDAAMVVTISPNSPSTGGGTVTVAASQLPLPVQEAGSAGINQLDLQVQILLELRAIRRLFAIMAEESGQARASDFDPMNTFEATPEIVIEN